MTSVNIVCPDNGAGLSQDSDIVRSALGSEFEVVISNSANGVEGYHDRKFDIGIHCEVLNAIYFRQCAKNFVIPNPEYYLDHWSGFKKSIDTMLCKTRHAQEVFNKLSYKTNYISFTSRDQDNGILFENKVKEFVHIAGKSLTKNTISIILLWNEHPEFPTLHVYSHLNDFSRYMTGKNIKYNFGLLTEEELKEIQNKYLFHLCTSEYEGFGHYLHEAKSCGAVVITTDAPPMRDMITVPSFLVAAEELRTQQRVKMNTITSEGLLKVIYLCMSANQVFLKQVAGENKLSFLENDLNFQMKFSTLIKNLWATKP